MTDSMKCPFCNADLIVHTDEQMAVCRNPNCKYDGWHLPLEIWQALIASKKAQRQLRTVKDRCVKKVKAKEREIESYLNGISVRQTENERLAKQLQQARDALEYAIGVLDNLTEIGGVDMEIIKIKKMAGITKQEE